MSFALDVINPEAAEPTKPWLELNFEVDRKSLSKAISSVVALIPWWKKSKEDDLSCLKITQVKGGITNLLYKVEHGTEKRPILLVRIFGDKTELLVDRERENLVFWRLFRANFAPPFYATFSNGRIEGYLECRNLLPRELPKFALKIAEKVAILHHVEMPFEIKPSLWTVLSNWLRVCQRITFEGSATKAAVLEKINLANVQERLLWLQSHLPNETCTNKAAISLSLSEQHHLDIAATEYAYSVLGDVCFAHNDLLSGNILIGASGADVTIVDYEYGSYNYAGFDVANHFCEYAGFDFDLQHCYPSIAHEQLFLAEYVKKRQEQDPSKFAFPGECSKEDCLLAMAHVGPKLDLTHPLLQLVNRFALASHLWWGLWAIIQANFSPIEFDFIGYAQLRFEMGFVAQRGLFFGESESQGEEARGLFFGESESQGEEAVFWGE